MNLRLGRVDLHRIHAVRKMKNVSEHCSCLGVSSLKFCILATFVVKMKLSSDSGQYRHICSNNYD
jgi:hypothetical protein